MIKNKYKYIDGLLKDKQDLSMGYLLAENRESLVEMLMLIRDLLGMTTPDKLSKEEFSVEGLSKVDQMTKILNKIRSTSSQFNQAEIHSDQHN
jgi:hypothetical protein